MKAKRGRPPSERADGLAFIGFMADSETRLAIDYLTAIMERQSGVIPSRSMVIRHHLIEAYRHAYQKIGAFEPASSQAAVLDAEAMPPAAVGEDPAVPIGPKRRKRAPKTAK